MPEVVERYFARGTFEGIPAIQRRIVSDYRSDARKYAEGLDPVRIVNVFESIPAQLAEGNVGFANGVLTIFNIPIKDEIHDNRK